MAVKQTALVAKRPGRKTSPPPLQQAANAPSSTQPSIFCFDPKLAGPVAQWEAHLDRAVTLGFTHALFESPNATIASWLANFDLVETFVRECATRQLKPLADLKVNEDGSSSFSRDEAADVIVPQILKPLGLSHDPASHNDLISRWRPIVDRLVACGLSGIRCQSSVPLPLSTWHSIIRDRKLPADWIAIGWLFELSRHEKISALATFDFMPSSAAWWDGSAGWLIEEYNELRPHGRLLAFPHDPLVRRRSPSAPQERLAECSFRIATSATLADGWLMPMGYEHGVVNSDLRVYTAPEDFAQLVEGSPIELTQQIVEANQQRKMLTDAAHQMRQIAHGSHLTAIHRPDRDGPGHMIAINPGDVGLTNVDLRRSTARIGAIPATTPPQAVKAHGLVVVALQPLAPVPLAGADVLSIDAATAAPRIAIEKITPTADDGRYPVKRIAGDIVSVEADIFSDGHDVLAAELTWRPGNDAPVERMPMRLVVNDRWTAEFPLLRPGRHSFTVEAWLDRFGSFRRDLEKKISAGVDAPQDLGEGRALVEAAIKRSKGALATSLRAQWKKLDKAGSHAFLSPELHQLMRQADDRPFSIGREQAFAVDVDREAAAFASWYELFPRSMSGSPDRHGTLRDVIKRLPAVRAMGFDVLYFPPIHPIGRRNRKGRNNTLTAGPDDPGSPYAIGSQEGGHEAIHPELGTFEDFQALVRAAHENGLEIALDFAIQCSPDHPWIKQHPEWFQWRPDGSMKYAENPPKKYEDIVNVDFYAEGSRPSLWFALRDIVQGWVDLGVRTFRVDNPHTKPFPFWEWLIGDIHTRDPGVIFLAEAFTRPKIMYRLGKVGFTQSYTYFTWRNAKAEIVEYITELMRPSVADIYRPHFFVNTPDINPYFLQTSGRAGFLIRAAMAATLSGLWGVYSGFELCEAAALPGREEYLDSEKYEIRVRDFNAPGNIISEITRLNAIRNAHAALQSHMHTRFYNANNDNILYYGKQIGPRLELILVAINLDPHATQSAAVEIPLWDLGLPDNASVAVDDLMTGNRFSLHGKFQTITLDPSAMPFAIWKLSPEGRP